MRTSPECSLQSFCPPPFPQLVSFLQAHIKKRSRLLILLHLPVSSRSVYGPEETAVQLFVIVDDQTEVRRLQARSADQAAIDFTFLGFMLPPY